MAEFVVVTRKDNGTRQVINLDAVESVDVVPPLPLPPLDSNAAITEDHLGGAVVHFIGVDRGPTRVGLASVAVCESVEDFLSLKGSDADKLADVRAKKIAQIKADREKERAKAHADQEKATQVAAKKTRK